MIQIGDVITVDWPQRSRLSRLWRRVRWGYRDDFRYVITAVHTCG